MGVTAEASLDGSSAAPTQLQLFQPEAPTDDGARPVSRPSAPDRPECADGLASRLASRLGRPVNRLVVTDNRRRIFSARPQGDGFSVRVHRCLLDAPSPVLDHLATLIAGRGATTTRRKALGHLREHFERFGPALGNRPRPDLETLGVVVDLAEVRDEIDRCHFDGRLADVSITWGRNRRRRRIARSIQLGSYDDRLRLIRIHRALDRPDVPRYVIASVVHHELLHAVFPPEPGNGRRRVHTPAFRRRERAFPDHRRAEAWIRANLTALLAP